MLARWCKLCVADAEGCPAGAGRVSPKLEALRRLKLHAVEDEYGSAGANVCHRRLKIAL